MPEGGHCSQKLIRDERGISSVEYVVLPSRRRLAPICKPVRRIRVKGRGGREDNIVVTDEHPFFSSPTPMKTEEWNSPLHAGQWKPAQDLEPGMWLLRSPPEVAFERGFLPTGTHNDLKKHTQGEYDPYFQTRKDAPGNFVSTSARKQVAEEMARSKEVYNSVVLGEYVDGWLYYIYPDSVDDIDVNRMIPEHRHPEEYEFAVPGAISRERIMGAQPVYADGSVGEFVWNPNRVGPIVPYTPSN